MSILNFFHWSYWFAIPVAISDEAITALIVFFAVLLLVGIALKGVANKEHLEKFFAKVCGRWGSLCITMATLGYLYVFFRYERTPLFSYRIFSGLWLIGTLYWAYRVYHYQTKKIPDLRERYRKDAEKYAYLSKEHLSR